MTHRPLWDVKNISQSSSVVNAVNVITVTLQANIALASGRGSDVTISGLTTSDTPTNEALPLIYAATTEYRFFGLTGHWTQSSGTLLLQISNTSAGSALEVGVIYVFSFQLRNIGQGQSASSVSITALLLQDIMDSGPHLNAPLSVTDFKTKYIEQQTYSPGFSNRISVTLSMSTLLAFVESI